MRLSTSKHAPSGRVHRLIGRYNPHPVALAHACKLTCQYPPKHSPEVTFAQYDHVIETLSADRTNHSFGIRVLPRRARCSENLQDFECCDLAPECLAINRVSITDEKTRGIVSPTCLKELSGCPHSRRMLCDVDVQDSPTIMTQDDQHE